MQASFEEAINQLIARHPEYAAEAYYFMRNAIDYAAEQLNKSDQSPHLSAEELYLGACAYALDEYGPLARHLLASWNLRSSHDFGCIVYNLIEAGIFGRQNSDRQDEFEHLTPLCDILESPYSIMPIPPQTPEDEAEPAPPAPRKKAAAPRHPGISRGGGFALLLQGDDVEAVLLPGGLVHPGVHEHHLIHRAGGAQAQAGRLWVFEGGRDWRKHRTRQAVYKDLMRAARLFRVRLGGAHIGTHTARKIYAVERYHRTGSIEAVRQLLGHEREAVTMLYALADELTARRLDPGPRKGAITGGPTSSGAAGRAMPGPGADKP